MISHGEETLLGEVAEVNPKEEPLSPDDPFVPMDAVRTGARWVTYTEPRGKRSGARARSGDVLYARITPCLENGKVAQVQTSIERCGGSTEFIVLRAGPELLPSYLYYWATSPAVRDQAIQLMTGTTGRQRLRADDLANIRFVLPSIEEQRRTVDLLESIDEVARRAEESASISRTVLSDLTSDLTTGVRRIPDTYDHLLELE